MSVRLRRVVTEDGITLHGIDNEIVADTCIVHIHGKCGNFYQNDFISIMSNYYANAGFRFMAFNHRAHDCLVENSVDGRIVYTGGSVESIEAVRGDVALLCRMAGEQAQRVVLQGHSQGCEYALWHALLSEHVPELILLSPSDSKRLQQDWSGIEDLGLQAERLRQRYSLFGREWLSPEEYGVRGAEDYEIPITARALVELLQSDQIATFAFDEPWHHQPVRTRCFAYVGEADPLRRHSLSITEAGLRERVTPLRFFSLPMGDHHFHGHEETVLAQVVMWLRG